MPESTPDPDHIRSVFERYVALMTKGDTDGIVALYAEDAVVEDPVGNPPHEGREAIRAFYAKSGAIPMELEGSVRIAGREGACAMIARPGGGDVRIETLDTMAFGDDGLVVHMRAYWGPTNIVHG